MTIAFFTQNYTIADVTGLLTTLSVYRVFGPMVTGSVATGLINVNNVGLFGLTDSNEGSWVDGNIGYTLNVSNIIDNPPNNSFTGGYPNWLSFGTTFGAGVTITSLYYNLFASSTLAF